MTNSRLFRSFPLNIKGRDFVVGDIHGCFTTLTLALKEVGFDESKDRLFSVGDLVDRGPESADALDWIAKPWFHAVRGNHEQMAIGVAAGKHDLGNYMLNGGGWFLSMPESRQQLYAKAFDDLPLCIEVETKVGLVGIVHAEVEGYNWQAFTDAVVNAPSKKKLDALKEVVMWERSRIRHNECTSVDGIARLYVGHTPVRDYTVLGNVHYIDTGAVFGRKLTLEEID